MYAVINKSGCTERKGNVQLRLDFFLESDDPRYNDTLVEGKVIPFHSHFIYLPPDFTEDDVKAEMDFHLPNFYKAFQDRWDKVNGGMRHGWATEKRISPLDYSQLDSKKNYALRVAQCQDRVNELTELSYKPELKEGKEYPATAIDIGPGAIDRAGTNSYGTTRIDLANPANDTGIIDTFEVWAEATMSGINKVGTFYGSGTNYTSRDYEVIGTVEAGAKRTFSGLSIDVTTGDFAGMHFSVGAIERDSSGGAGYYYKEGDQFGTGVQTYSFLGGYATSIYGTGSTIPSLLTVSMDALLRATDTEAISLDALLKGQADTSVNLDLLIKTLEKQDISLDALIVARNLESISMDALLKGLATKTISLDAYIRAINLVESVNLDMLIADVGLTKTVALDAILKYIGEQTVDLDAILKGIATTSVSLDTIIGEALFALISLDTILFKALPPDRIYTIEIRNGDGDLLAILENAHGISYAQIINSPHALTFNLPANDSKASNILLANECWLRDNQTDTVIRKFKLQRKVDMRT